MRLATSSRISAGLAWAKLKRAGQRGQAPAAVRVGHAAEVVDQERHLGVALRRVEQAVEQVGERLHAAQSLRQAGIVTQMGQSAAALQRARA